MTVCRQSMYTCVRLVFVAAVLVCVDHSVMPIIRSYLVVLWLLSCFTVQSVPPEYLCQQQQLFYASYFISIIPVVKTNCLTNLKKLVEIYHYIIVKSMQVN